MASNKQVDYLLVAAIDFGTPYSGYAFSDRADFIKEPTKVYTKQWTDPCSLMLYNKTSTCVLFTKEKHFSHFGFDAEYKYNELIEENDHKEWYFFRRFKMSLYALKSNNEDFILEDETGKSMPALTVFSVSIRYLKDDLLGECTKQNSDINVDDIKWVITVPAIWSNPAKAFMRSAALQAGINSNMLTIALEPEAAAFYVKHVPVEKKVDGKVGEGSPGSMYIVVDAGGGTVDLTAHEVQTDGRVNELIKANGGDWGGTKVDDKYMEFIRCLVGETVTKTILEDQTHIFFETCREFEKAKRTIKPDSDTRFSVRIPSELSETYAKHNDGKDLKSIKTVSLKNKTEIGVTLAKDKIKLASGDAEDFFAESISNISDHLSKLFRQKSGKGITTIILVGGYAESPVLINAIKYKFPHMRTIIPQEAASSVLRGAVMFGHDSSLIKKRRSNYTYGVHVRSPFDPSMHDAKYKCKEDGEVWCHFLFDKLIEIDQLVTVGESQFENQYTMHKVYSGGNISLYSSTSKNPTYIDEDGCSFIGRILSPGHKFLPNESITVKMFFGETEIKFVAHQPKSQLTATYYLGQ